MNASILTEFSFGHIELERFELIPTGGTNEDSKHSDIVRTTMDLETVAVATQLDAIDSAIENELALNCKIVPYHYGIVAVVVADADRDDYLDLAKLCRLLMEEAGLSVLCHDNAASVVVVADAVQLDREFDRMDSVGVPYVLILDAESLRTGLLRLRSRDTTLAETIHLTDIPEYLQQIVGRWSGGGNADIGKESVLYLTK